MQTELSIPDQVALWDRRAYHPAAYPAEPDAQLRERLAATPARMRQALDLGCGHGRHLALLSGLGWRCTGLDWAGNALAAAKRTMDAAGRHANLVKADFRHLPFGPASFHLIIATRALHHGRLADCRRTLLECHRVLYAGCQVLISLPTLNNAPLSAEGAWVEEGTLVLSHGVEAGIPHHFFTGAEIEDCAQHFSNISLDRVVEPFPPGVEPLHDGHINEWYWVTLTS